MANSSILLQLRSINKAASSSQIAATIEFKYSRAKDDSCSSSAPMDQTMVNSVILLELRSINKAASSSQIATISEFKCLRCHNYNDNNNNNNNSSTCYLCLSSYSSCDQYIHTISINRAISLTRGSARCFPPNDGLRCSCVCRSIVVACWLARSCIVVTLTACVRSFA